MLSPFEQAAFLGILHGFTELLPVSSDGHLALARTLLELDPAGLSLNVLLELGTLLAVLAYFRERIVQVTRDLWQELARGQLPRAGTPGRDALLVFVAAVPAGVVGLLLRAALTGSSERPLAIGFGFIASALLLISTLWARPGTLSSPSLAAAALLGVAQGLASAPGLSRSGSVIVAALWLGVRPERAFELSMLMSIPALAAPLILELFASDALTANALPLLVGVSVAFGAGLVSLAILRRTVLNGHLSWFALWLLPLALATLALAKAWPS
jgi:undecaprenyl-diphosphatase